MAKRISGLNGNNKTQDYDLAQYQSSSVTEGVGDLTHLKVTQQVVPDNTVIVQAGVVAIDVTRVVDGKDFKLFGELTANENLTILDTGVNPTWIGAVIAIVPKADVENGTLNPETGIGIFDVIAVAGLGVSALSDAQINSQTGNLYYWFRLADVLQDPTIEDANITDTRELLGARDIALRNDVPMRIRNNADNAWIEVARLTTADIFKFDVIPQNDPGRSIGTDYQLIDKKYFEDNLPTSSSISFVLAENLTANDLVKIINDGGVAKIKELIVESEGTFQELDPTNISQGTDAVAINTNKVVAVWANTNVTYAIAFTISGTVLTIGTRVTVNPANAGKPTIAKLDTDKFVVTYEDRTANTYEARAATVSGTTITLGTVAIISSAASLEGRVLQLDTDKFVALWDEGGALKGRAATVAGTTISFGTEQTLDATSTNFNYLDGAIEIATDKFYIVSQNKAYYCTVSGTVIAASSRDLGNSATSFPKIFKVDSTHFIVFEGGEVLDSKDQELHLFEHDNNGTEIFLQTMPIPFIVTQIIPSSENNKFYIFESTGWRKGFLYGNKLFFSDLFVSATSPTRAISRAANFDSSGDEQFVTIIGDTISGLVGNSNNFEDLAGILQETGTTGQSKTVSVLGSVSNFHSFAASDVGKTVYQQSDGSLDIPITGYPVGKILTTDKIVINNNNVF